jgi:magnesium transporter
MAALPKKELSQRENRKRRNNLLYGGLNYNGIYTHATQIHLINYDSAHCETTEIKQPKDLKLRPNVVNWVHVSGLSNEKVVVELCEKLNLALPVVQDILNARHIAKLEETGGCLFAVMDAYGASEGEELSREHQSMILGPNFVLSFEEGQGHRFDPVRKALLENVGQVRMHGPDFLFNLLISIGVDSYFDVIEIQQNNLLEIEDSLMEFNAAHKETGQQIQHYRREYTRLKKAIAPFREEFGRVLMFDSVLIQDSSRVYFRDTYDHLQQVMSMLEANRETLASLVDLYIANNDLHMNQIMKQLTVVATIFIPLTFLVGVWGMNFMYMPELSMVHGYLYAWLAMIAVGILLYFWFRRKNML